jgi:hypothetical protein
MSHKGDNAPAPAVLGYAAVFSLLINLLMLMPALFMLQVRPRRHQPQPRDVADAGAAGGSALLFMAIWTSSARAAQHAGGRWRSCSGHIASIHDSADADARTARARMTPTVKGR